MKTQRAKRETSTATEDIRNIAVLTLALRVICIANQLKLHRESMTVTRPPQGEVKLEFSAACRSASLLRKAMRPLFMFLPDTGM